MQKKYLLILLFSVITHNVLTSEKKLSIVTQLQQSALGQRDTFNLRNFELFKIVSNDIRQITSVEFSSNGLLAVAMYFDDIRKIIQIYDAATGEWLKTLGSQYVIKSMSWSANGKYLLTFSGYLDYTALLGIWDIEKKSYTPINVRQHEPIIYAGFIGNDKIVVCTACGRLTVYDLQAKRVTIEDRSLDIGGYCKIRLTPDHSKIIIRRDKRDRLTIFDLKARIFQTLNFEHMAHDYFFSYYGDFLYVVQKNESNEYAREQDQLKTKLTIIDLRTMETVANNVDCALNFDKCKGATTQFVTPDVTLTQVADEMLFFDFKQNKEIYYKKLNNNSLWWVKAFNNIMAFQFNRCVIVYKIYDVNKIATIFQPA